MGQENFQVDVRVKGFVPHIRQKGYTCWAAAAAMMHSWRNQQTFSIAQAIDFAGEPYKERLKRGRTLRYEENEAFAASMGMKCTGNRSFGFMEFCNLMTLRCSPLMVCILQVNADMAHFNVATRLYVSEEEMQMVVVNDSNREDRDIEKFFDDFAIEIEKAAAGSTRLEAQILHY